MPTKKKKIHIFLNNYLIKFSIQKLTALKLTICLNIFRSGLRNRLLVNFGMMANALKQATNLTGLKVSQNPKYILNRLYKRILGVLGKMPENSAYRKYTEEVIKQRSYIINSTQDVETMEKKIGCGQIEEIIIQAQKELLLAENLLLFRPWEVLKTSIPNNQWKWPPK